MKRDKLIKRCRVLSSVTYVLGVVSLLCAFADIICVVNGNIKALWMAVLCGVLTWVFFGLYEAFDRRARNAGHRR